jgi:heat shock protein HslJ
MLTNHLCGLLLLALSVSYGQKFENNSPNDRLDLVEELAISQGQLVRSSELIGTSWQLVKFHGAGDNTVLPDDKTKYTITFGTDGKVTARIDCNSGAGTWKSPGPNQIQFGPLALSVAICPPGSLHNQIVEHWSLMQSYSFRDEHLFLSLKDHAGAYEFEPVASAASLTGGKWILAEMNGNAVTNDRAYIKFDAQSKRFSASGGCNDIGGRYQVDDTQIKFSELTTTLIACKNNEAHRLEGHLMDRLSDVTDFQIEGGTLRLYVGNRPILAFKASP